MDGGELLSLKWNHHQSSFLRIIGSLRFKSLYTDVTLACDGKFFSVHKLVLSTCSAYFNAIFEHTSCPNPVIVLKDINCKNLEYLLDYMYVGEVNVKQNELATLVMAAECLKIKGLAVPDEESNLDSYASSNNVKEMLKNSVPKKPKVSHSNNDEKRAKGHKNTLDPLNERNNFHIKIFNNNNSDTNSCDGNNLENQLKQEPPDVEPCETDTWIQNPNVDVSKNNKTETDDLQEFFLENAIEKEEPEHKDDIHTNELPGPSGLQSDINKTMENNCKLDQNSILDAPNEQQMINYQMKSDLQTSQFLSSLEYPPSHQQSMFLKDSVDQQYLDHHERQMQSNPLVNIYASQCLLSRVNANLLPSDYGLQNQFKKTKKNPMQKCVRERFLYKCSTCNYTCSTNKHLTRHKLLHTNEKLFNCPCCEYVCTNKSNFERHVRIHTGEKPFKCPQCEYRCGTSFALKRHIRVHTGEKPYQCPFCDHHCSTSSGLKTHVRSHTGEKPFGCPVCMYKSTNSAALKLHIRSHTGEKPFACPFCKYKCTNSAALKVHVRTHTGEKPYKCPYCKYCALKSCHLKKHIRTHTGERPYKCSLCNYRSSTSTTLSKHMLRHNEKISLDSNFISHESSLAESII